MSSSLHITHIVSRAAREIFWPYVRHAGLRQQKLLTTIGRRKQSFYESQKGDCTHHRITFSAVEVDALRRQHNLLNNDISKELLDRELTNGAVNVPRLLSHLIAHQMTHCLQTVRGANERARHGENFYQFMDEIYSQGLPAKAKEFIINECNKKNISLSFVDTEKVNLYLSDINYSPAAQPIISAHPLQAEIVGLNYNAADNSGGDKHNLAPSYFGK